MKPLAYLFIVTFIGYLSFAIYSVGGPVAKLWLIGVILITAHSYYCNRTSKRGPY